MFEVNVKNVLAEKEEWRRNTAHTVLYCTVLYYIVLYYTTPCCNIISVLVLLLLLYI